MNVVQLYMTEVGRHPLLSAEEEVVLAKQYALGREAACQLASADTDESEHEQLKAAVAQGNQARQRLIRCNLRLVVSVAKQYLGCGLPFSDLMQEGNIGLMEAVERYDHRRGTRFSTYAVWWIRQSVQRAVANYGRTIRLPIQVNDRLYRLRQAQRKLEGKLGRRPTVHELAQYMELTPKRIRRLLVWNRQTLSLEMPVGEEGDGELGDWVPDQKNPPLEEVTARHQMEDSVHDVLSERLRPREKTVLQMRFGLDGSEEQTLKQVAEKLGVTRERVRQIEARALRRLRHVGTRHELREAWI